MSLLQVALDMTDLDRALAIAEAVSPEVDIIEAGTPLIKGVGMNAVRELRRRFPNLLIFADTKTMDAGALEASLVFDAGADIFSICAAASRVTIMAGIEEAHYRGRQALVDLIGVEDVLDAAWRLEGLAPDYICLHVGIDQQMAEGRLPLDGLGLLGERLGLSLAVAGGITPRDVPEVARINPRIVIVGAYITASPDPAKAAREIREAMEEALAE
jgi:3-hexulose-6-phosphate synthase